MLDGDIPMDTVSELHAIQYWVGIGMCVYCDGYWNSIGQNGSLKHRETQRKLLSLGTNAVYVCYSQNNTTRAPQWSPIVRIRSQLMKNGCRWTRWWPVIGRVNKWCGGLLASLQRILVLVVKWMRLCCGSCYALSARLFNSLFSLLADSWCCCCQFFFLFIILLLFICCCVVFLLYFHSFIVTS